MSTLTINTASDDVMRLIKAIKAYCAIYGKNAVYIRKNKSSEGYYIGLPKQKEFAQNLTVHQAIQMLERYTVPTAG